MACTVQDFCTSFYSHPRSKHTLFLMLMYSIPHLTNIRCHCDFSETWYEFNENDFDSAYSAVHNSNSSLIAPITKIPPRTVLFRSKQNGREIFIHSIHNPTECLVNALGIVRGQLKIFFFYHSDFKSRPLNFFFILTPWIVALFVIIFVAWPIFE